MRIGKIQNMLKGGLQNNRFFIKSLAILTGGSLIGTLITALSEVAR